MDQANVSGHPPNIREPALWAASLSVSPRAQMLFTVIQELSLKGRRFAPGYRRLAELQRCTPRTIERALAELKGHGLIRVIRVGKRLNNVLRLAKTVWCRLTGRWPKQDRRADLQLLLGDLAARVGLVYTPSPERRVYVSG